MSLLAFDRVSFGYNGRPVLRDASFAIEEGEAWALVGPNGAGKSTLLRLAMGILQPASGAVLLGGKPLAGVRPREAAKSVAMVPQSMELPFAFTVGQVVAQGRTPYLGTLRGAGERDRAAVERALALTDTAQFRDRIFNELSGGERQRVKIALALAQEPRLLLLDEPTQSLDLGRQRELMGLLGLLQGEGVTLLATMHDLHHIPGNFARVLLLSPGGRLESGSPDVLQDAARVEALFAIAPFGREAGCGL